MRIEIVDERVVDMSDLDRFITEPKEFPKSEQHEISDEYMNYYNSIGREIDRQKRESLTNLEKSMHVTFGSDNQNSI